MTTTTELDPCTDIDALLLKHGAHGSHFDGECCLVEYANRLTVCKPDLREKFGAAKTFTDDHPSISRVIRSFAISFNDGLTDDQKRTDLLKPYAAKILGTKTNAADEKTRAWMATDWLVRVQTPAWLDLAGLSKNADALRALPALTNSEIARGVQSVLEQARTDAAAAWAAAWAAARDAARDAAWAAAWAAAWDAARAKLAPTVEVLQASALELLDRMIALDSRTQVVA